MAETQSAPSLREGEIVTLIAKVWLTEHGVSDEVAADLSDPEEFPHVAAEDWAACAAIAKHIIHRHEATLTEAVAAARAETERYKTALKLAMGLVQRCVGEGITFEEDDPLPEMESWKVAEAIAETLGIDMNSAAYVDLFKGPLTPGGRTDG